MKKFIITITREFGSLGRTIAKELAEELGVEYYDREIVERVSKTLNLPVSIVSDAEENAKTSFFSTQFPLGTQTTAMQDKIFETQRQLILNLAEKGSCIIVGRCADYILQNDPDSYHVFIYASYQNRFNNCVQRLHMSEAAAEKSIAAVDKARDRYHKQYTGYLQSDYRHKNISIDSGKHGTQNTVKLLAAIIREQFADDACTLR